VKIYEKNAGKYERKYREIYRKIREHVREKYGKVSSSLLNRIIKKKYIKMKRFALTNKINAKSPD
jgi:hypothetical protein